MNGYDSGTETIRDKDGNQVIGRDVNWKPPKKEAKTEIRPKEK